MTPPVFAAASIYWDAPVLLVTFSLVYAATRHDRWDRILWEAAEWAGRIGGFLVTVAVGLYVLSSYPDHWPYLAVVGGLLAAVYYFLTGYYLPRRRKKKPG